MRSLLSALSFPYGRMTSLHVSRSMCVESSKHRETTFFQGVQVPLLIRIGVYIRLYRIYCFLFLKLPIHWTENITSGRAQSQ